MSQDFQQLRHHVLQVSAPLAGAAPRCWLSCVGTRLAVMGSECCRAMAAPYPGPSLALPPLGAVICCIHPSYSTGLDPCFTPLSLQLLAALLFI